jgi:hypothetical protein
MSHNQYTTGPDEDQEHDFVGTSNELLNAALELAEAGFHVFRLRPNTKFPVAKWPQEATNDPARVRELWADGAPYNIGLATGPSGLAVLDLDRKNGNDGVAGFRRLCEAHGTSIRDLPPTISVATASGGAHVYYRGRAGNSAHKLAPGIDTRGEGGYVVGPGSLIDGKPYVLTTRSLPLGSAIPELPGWIASLMAKGKSEPRKASGTIDTPTQLDQARIEARAARPAVEGEGSDDQANRLCNRMLDLVSPETAEELLTLYWLPRCQFSGDDGLTPEDWLHRKIESAAKTRQNGIGCDTASSIPANLPKTVGVVTTLPRIVLRRALVSDAKDVEWLWDGWLPRGKITLLAGMPDDGKTTVAMNLAAVLSRGGRWPDGKAVETAGATLIWSGEDGWDDTLVPRFLAAGGKERDLILVDQVSDNGVMREFDPATDLDRINDALDQCPDARLLILDPIINTFNAQAGDTAKIRRALTPLKTLAERRNIAVLGLTHFAKGTQELTLLERLIGSQAIGAAARSVWATVRNEKTDQRRMINVKHNLAKGGDAVDYQLSGRKVPGRPELREQPGAVWIGKATGKSAREFYMEVAGDDQVAPRVQARDFILNLIPNVGDQIASVRLNEAASEHGIATATMKRARQELAKDNLITARQVGEAWFVYRLPGDQPSAVPAGLP